MVLGFPQPQILYLGPGEEKRVMTFLEKERIATGSDYFGEHIVTLAWEFIDQETKVTQKETVPYKFIVLKPEEITGDMKVSGKVVDAQGKAVSQTFVYLSNGPTGWTLQTQTGTDGTFSFPGVPKRSDWFLNAVSVNATQTNNPVPQPPSGSSPVAPPPPGTGTVPPPPGTNTVPRQGN